MYLEEDHAGRQWVDTSKGVSCSWRTSSSSCSWSWTNWWSWRTTCSRCSFISCSCLSSIATMHLLFLLRQRQGSDEGNVKVVWLHLHRGKAHLHRSGVAMLLALCEKRTTNDRYYFHFLWGHTQVQTYHRLPDSLRKLQRTRQKFKRHVPLKLQRENKRVNIFRT